MEQSEAHQAVYLDCSATTPLEPEVREVMLRFFDLEYGNPGSRTHEYGNTAKKAVQLARQQIADVADAKREEIIFTSGATEANNIALLGLTQHGLDKGRKHIVSTAIEHKAVLEPLEELESRGFEVDLIAPDSSGIVDADRLLSTVREDTLVVSVMQANNETGMLQPIETIARMLDKHDAYLHVDAAQGFGKELDSLRNKRIDLISASAHKLFGPKGVGALVARRRGFNKCPLRPLVFGGGQERGLRPGTLPAPLIAGFGEAAKLAVRDQVARRESCLAFREELLSALQLLEAQVVGDTERSLPHVASVRFPGLDSEAVMLALRGIVAVSNGSACTSSSYEPSHVLSAMGLSEDESAEAIRFSWCHMSKSPDWALVLSKIREIS